jgi:hypothetical protein
MKKQFLCLLVFISLIAHAGDGSYSIATIPEALLKGSNTVMRMEDVRLEISGDDMIYYRKYALTILNENGSEYAWAVLNYDKLRTVQIFEGTLYDAFGKQLKKVKNKDIQDVSAISDISLYEDNRRKVHNFNYNVYPYTIEYETEIKIKNTYSMPSWMAQRFADLAVEKSSFTVIAPETYKVRYKTFNVKEEPIIKTEKGRKAYLWQVSNLAPIAKLYAAPLWHERTPAVYIAPSNFEMEGYKGNGSTWEELGKFPLALNQGRDKLPEDIVQKVRQLTANLTEEKEMIKALYQFLQQNTRYISIQLGIGGLQPFEASFVAQKGYGDCKALSNYMYSLLKAAGIKSYYTLVKAGRDDDDHFLIEDFPVDQFNHIILCVPTQMDTMWLECTSQTTPAGYMGSFTGNRKALLITENGGKLVPTPHYGVKENTQTSSVNGTISKEGDLSFTVKTVYSGEQQDYIQSMINALSKDKVKKELNERLNLSTYDVNDFKYLEKPSSMPSLEEDLAIYVSSYATVSGKRIFIYPNVLNRSGTRISEDERKLDFVFNYEYRDVDTVQLTIPEGYTLEAVPQNIALKTKYGLYTSTLKIDGNKLFYVRIREQYKGRYPASEKEDLTKFYDTIYKSDRSRVVLVKKDQ